MTFFESLLLLMLVAIILLQEQIDWIELTMLNDADRKIEEI